MIFKSWPILINKYSRTELSKDTINLIFLKGKCRMYVCEAATKNRVSLQLPLTSILDDWWRLLMRHCTSQIELNTLIRRGL